MKRKNLWICLLVVSMLLAGCKTGASDTTPSVETTESTRPTAPDFTVYDENGNPHKLSDYFGKPIVLNFWASWCPPCKAEMPEFNVKYKELGDEIQFLMVNVTYGDVFQDALDHVRQQGYQFPVLYDHTGEAAYTYQVEGIPVTYFINAEGVLVTHRVGMLSGAELDTYIGMIRTNQ